MNNKERIISIIQPETHMEEAIINDEDFIQGVLYGKPRPGHPEGEVLAHIAEVLANVEKYASNDDLLPLRLIAIIHDSFKFKVDRAKPKSGENHHAMLARRFAERMRITDQKVLNIIELHDEAYNAWCKGDRDGKWPAAEKRAVALIERLEDIDALDLYLTFYQCDNETGDKEQFNVKWFKELI